MKNDDDILLEAKDRFKKVAEYESVARENYRQDMRFLEGDAYNMYAWDADNAKVRMQSNKPTLTVPKAKVHVRQVVNDALKNKPSIKIRPTGNMATWKAAEIFEGIIRHIEYISEAQDAYDTATFCQVGGGVGYWYVTTDYTDENSFDQEIFIRPVSDPSTVYLDPDTVMYDGSDANWGFISREIPNSQFRLDYPDYKELEGTSLGLDGEDQRDDWSSESHTRIADYYKKIEVEDTLYLLPDGSTMLRSVAEELDILKDVKKQAIRERNTTTTKIKIYKIAGNQIIGEADWAGTKYIPIIRVLGEQTHIDGQLDRKGLTRALLDPCRIFNALCSANIEAIGLATKIPYLAAAKSIEKYETEWAVANVTNLSYLPYDPYDDEGRQLERPERILPPQPVMAYLEGMKAAEEQMMMSTGMYQASFGQESNERSGRAINERQRIGQTATYHYIDHLSKSIRYCGRILLELIPKVYDTPRIMRILGEDGEATTVVLDPNAQQATQDVMNEFNAQDVMHVIMNVNVGSFDVQSDVQPNYATRRQEAFNAITQILSENPALTSVIGDLLFRVADFPLANEIAERLKNMTPPQALGQGPNPQVQQLQQMLAQQHQVMQTQATEIEQLKNKTLLDAAQKSIDVYNAQTNRYKNDPAALQLIVREEISRHLGEATNPLIHAHALENAATQGIIAQMTPQANQENQGEQNGQPT